MWKRKLKCPKCGGKGRPRKHYEEEQCECVKCGYTGKREEFEKEPSVRRRAGEGDKPTTPRPRPKPRPLKFSLKLLDALGDAILGERGYLGMGGES